jgi:DMSO/TMAO reductase YedYZ molybdopterin-dependent catalytic subunit
MSDSTTHDVALVATRNALVGTAPDELELRPIEGMARWLGRLLHPIAFRMVSMVEQRPATMVGPLTPIAGYFRRDRHRHPKIDAASWRLRITGVKRPRELSLEDLRVLAAEERLCVMECAGNGNHLMGSAGLLGQARWAGPSLAAVLEACGGPGEATHFAFHGLDPIPLVRRGYHYGLSLDELTRSRALLALTMNGEPLPRERGFPLRLVVPGIYSMSHVKWLGHIEGKTSPHLGIHNRWVFTNKVRGPSGWQRVQARWIGLKSMVTRCQRSADGPRGADSWLLSGWAWGGGKPIDAVEVSTDGGKSWHAAEVRRPESYFPEQPLAPEATEHAWTVWTYRWETPTAGQYRIGSRAHASDGSLQDLEQDPNVEGHFNQTRVKWREVRVP